MKLGRGEYENFGSYKNLVFDFSDQGLTLISGPTGAGKSTLFDAACWCLFGVTSKEGEVDDVRRWGSDEVTRGEQHVTLADTTLVVVRIRGTRPSQNDLYFTSADGIEQRGKDLKETQKLLETRLGVSGELFIMSAYLTQFSRVDTFFVAKAKERRDTFEKIADLELPAAIAERSSETRKEAKTKLEELRREEQKLEGQIQVYESQINDSERRAADWDKSWQRNMEALQSKSDSFESVRQKEISDLANRIAAALNEESKRPGIQRTIEESQARVVQLEDLQKVVNDQASLVNRMEADLAALRREYSKFAKAGPTICPHCLGPTNNENKSTHINKLHNQIERQEKQIQALRDDTNRQAEETLELPLLKEDQANRRQTLKELDWQATQTARMQKELVAKKAQENTYLEQIEKEKKTQNPYVLHSAKLRMDTSTATHNLTICRGKIDHAEHLVLSLTQLYDLSSTLRGKLLIQAIESIEEKTNENIQKYFDGDIRVKFTLDGDKLDVGIQKNGYDCTFRQLSGGQRQMLKLAFALPLMAAAANRAGIHFGELFLDEPLNGLSSDLKIKAFSLFQRLELEHDSVFIIDHAEEFKNLFSGRVQVTMKEDISEVTHG